MTSSIPSAEPRITIGNLYYLLCYAFGELEEMDQVDVEAMPEAEVADLFSNVLCSGIDRLVRRGLDRDYQEHREDSRTIRGRIDFAESTSRLLFQNAMAAVTTAELSFDILQNQILKATLCFLREMSFISAKSLLRVDATLRVLARISDIRLTASSFRRVQLHGNNRLYRFLLEVCELIFDTLMVAPGGRDCSFRSFVRDEGRMWKVWQGFLRNFYAFHLNGYSEGPRTFRWGEEPHGLMPSLNTDVTLCNAERVIILDAKYTPNTFSKSTYGSAKLHSSHVNQVFAYAMNVPGNWPERHAGLVYPECESPVRIRSEASGCTLWAWTVDLSAPWPAVSSQIRQVVADVENSGSAVQIGTNQ